MARKKGRAAGEGHIRQRSDGLWEARLPIPGRAPRSVYGKTEKEAIQKRNKLRQDIEGGYSIDSQSQSLGNYLEQWLTGPLPYSVSPRTLSDYTYTCRKYVIPEIGHIKLTALNGHHLDAMYYKYLRQGRGEYTVRKIHQTLTSALKRAVRKGLIPRSPTDSADPPQVAKSQAKTLSLDELRRFVDAASDDAFGAAFILSGLTGMRPSEVLGLMWDDLDLPSDPTAAGTCHVRRSLSEVRGKLYLRETTKTGKGRAVHLLPEAVAALRRHRQRQLETRMRKGSRWEESGLVFPNGAGGLMNPGNVRRYHFKPILKKAELPAIRWYDLRHTFATLWLESGEPVKVLSEILGHAHISRTLDTYSHVLPHMQQRSMTNFGKRLAEPPGD